VRRNPQSRGFTILEALVAVAILGTAVAAGMSVLSTALRNAGRATPSMNANSPNSASTLRKCAARTATVSSSIAPSAARAGYGSTSKTKSPSVTCVSTDSTRHSTR